MDADVIEVIEDTAAETRRHFDVVAERLDYRLDLLTEVVQHVHGEVQRTRVELEAKIDATAAETRALFQVTYADLDRRVRILEASQSR